jgi:hypothetical protein
MREIFVRPDLLHVKYGVEGEEFRVGVFFSTVVTPQESVQASLFPAVAGHMFTSSCNTLR